MTSSRTADHSRDDATWPSRRRWVAAVALAASCPDELGREIALTGSVARGQADEASDVEVNVWSDAHPDASARGAWLRAAGAEEVWVDVDATPDGTAWTTCRIGTLWLEVAWQTLAAQERVLGELLSGTVTDHHLLVVASAIECAVPLRTAGALSAWQRAVGTYPEGLAERLIERAVGSWVWPQWAGEPWAYARRGERFALADRLVADVRGCLRVLFALNRRWEPGWKWARVATETLAIRPERLTERIEGVFTADDAETSIRRCTDLILAVLALVPDDPLVTRARDAIGAMC
jgi:hypothetical protein